MLDNDFLERRINEVKVEFDNIQVQITNTLNKANEEINKLSEDIEKIRSSALNETKQLQAKQEQLRGVYTEYMSILHPELQYVNSQPEINESAVQGEPQIEQQPVQENVVEVQTEEVSESLNVDDIVNKLNNQTTNQQPVVTNLSTKINKTNPEDDIPDYLKDEYNKK